MMMPVRPGRIPTQRGQAEAVSSQKSQPITYPAPTLGLVTSASYGTDPVASARVLNNWIPTLNGARIRGGSAKHGRAADVKDIKSMFRYKYGSSEVIFAATESAIYNMSAPPTPPSTVAASVSGMLNGDWCAFQHANSGGSFLLCVNGANARQIFNGSTWATTPAITFSDGTTESQLNYGFTFKNREFYLKNASLDAYYLQLNAISGAASVFPLGGVLKKGGSLLTGFTWSLESGDGLGDYCVFITTEGEVAIYSGSDPSSATDFALKGVYQIGKPLGKNAWIRAGGDVLVATIDGLIPMSQVFTRDRATLQLVSISRPIEDLWKTAALASGNGWTLSIWQNENVVFVAFPENLIVPDTTFVLNVQTGKWSTISNWKAVAYQEYQGSIFFGSESGYVYHGDLGGTDDGLAFQAAFLSGFSDGGQIGQRKTSSLASMFFKSFTKPSVRLFSRADDDLSIPSFSATTMGESGSGGWDVGLWDEAKWDGTSQIKQFHFRQNVRATGDIIAMGCVVNSAGDYKLYLELGVGILQMAPGMSRA